MPSPAACPETQAAAARLAAAGPTPPARPAERSLSRQAAEDWLSLLSTAQPSGQHADAASLDPPHDAPAPPSCPAISA